MTYLLQHGLMESAQRLGDRDAAVCVDATLSYAELDEWSNQLANALYAAGCRAGDRVGILMPKSVEAVVAIHGILKAGAAYVPLDPSAPTRRLSYILRDCGITRLVTTARKLRTLSEMPLDEAPLSAALLLAGSAHGLDSPWEVVEATEIREHESGRGPDHGTVDTDLAYLLYTSGSTGVPKGVMISHLNSLTFARWARETFAVAPEDRVSNHAPLHFDLSIFDIFSTFLAGASLHLVPPGTSAFPAVLADWIASSRITIWYSVPSILSMLVRQGGLERHSYGDLRTVLFAGEVFPVKYLRAWLERVPHAEFYNLYGPTETNVITFYRVERLDPEETRPVPIGLACENSDVFALQSDGSPVERPGEEGELYARGSIVAQGYWGDRVKTESVFLQDGDRPHLRNSVYRTGDLVTLDEEGNFIFLGRRDHMIKRSGYRIELGEIESALYGHPGVREAAVVAEPEEELGNRLLAFVVAEPGTELTATALRSHLVESIPKYMMPDELSLRDELPKTSTGKIDRQGLSAVGAAAATGPGAGE